MEAVRRVGCEFVALMQDEVRALGRLPALNVPEAFITRHPFPGALSLTITMLLCTAGAWAECCAVITPDRAGSGLGALICTRHLDRLV